MTTKPTGAIKVAGYIPKKLSSTSLEASGFQPFGEPPPNRLIAVVMGDKKTGKTYFSLSADPFIFYFQFDTGGDEGVADKQLQGKAAYIYRVSVPPGANQEWFMKSWQDFLSSVLGAYDYLDAQGSGTIIIDTWDGAYAHAQMGYMGKLTQNNRPQYGVIYADLNQIRDRAYQSQVVDTLLLNKMEVGFTSGKREPSGYKDTPYLALVNLETYRKENGKGEMPTFGVRIIDCRRNMQVTGEELEDEMADWNIVKGMILS